MFEKKVHDHGYLLLNDKEIYLDFEEKNPRLLNLFSYRNDHFQLCCNTGMP